MKIDVTTPLLDIDDVQSTRFPTLRDACVYSLINLVVGDERMTGEEKFDLDGFARKIKKNDQPDLGETEWKRVRERIGRALDPTAVGAAWRAIDDGIRLAKDADAA